MSNKFWRDVQTTIEVGVLIVPPLLIASALLAAAVTWALS